MFSKNYENKYTSQFIYVENEYDDYFDVKYMKQKEKNIFNRMY